LYNLPTLMTIITTVKRFSTDVLGFFVRCKRPASFLFDCQQKYSIILGCMLTFVVHNDKIAPAP